MTKCEKLPGYLQAFPPTTTNGRHDHELDTYIFYAIPHSVGLMVSLIRPSTEIPRAVRIGIIQRQRSVREEPEGQSQDCTVYLPLQYSDPNLRSV